MGDYQLEVVVQQIQQTTTNKVEDNGNHILIYSLPEEDR